MTTARTVAIGKVRPASAMALAALIVAGCAANSQIAPQFGQKAPDTYVPGKPYQLTAEELGLDCKKLTGRMQVRILQIRDTATRGQGSAVARTTQKLAVPVIGGTTRGVDPEADAVRDRAMLEAMNQQLARKNCPTFNLADELQPRSFRDTPTPVPSPTAPPKR